MARLQATSRPHYYVVATSDDDLKRIAPVLASAERNGDRFWIAQRHGRADSEIAQAVRDCTGLILVSSGANPACPPLDLSYASRANKPIFAVLMDGGPASSALSYHISVRDMIDASDPDWRLHFHRLLDGMASLRPLAPVALGKRKVSRPGMSFTQSFVNAFAAGALALFAIAALHLTGGPPTGYELQDVALRVWHLAERFVPA